MRISLTWTFVVGWVLTAALALLTDHFGGGFVSPAIAIACLITLAMGWVGRKLHPKRKTNSAFQFFAVLTMILGLTLLTTLSLQSVFGIDATPASDLDNLVSLVFVFVGIVLTTLGMFGVLDGTENKHLAA